MRTMYPTNLKRLTVLASTALLVAGAFSAQAAKNQGAIYYPHTGEVVSAEDYAKVDRSNEKTVSTRGAGGTITWTLNYLDGAGVGFNDPTHGANRKAVLNAVLAYIDSVIAVPSARTVIVDVEASGVIGGTTLAQAGTFYDTSVGGYFPGDAFDKIVTNVDNFAGAEIFVKVDFTSWTWNNDTGPVASGETDLFTVLLHEITHGLGVASLTDPDGTSAFAQPVFTTWDNLLYKTSGATKIWNGSQAYQLASGDLDLGNNTLDFRGTNTQAAFGSFPPIYSPGTFASGSSISHWQLASPIPASTVMRPAIAANTEIRTYNVFEIQALRDLGFPIATAVNDWNLY